jgi:hypothetical protein
MTELMNVMERNVRWNRLISFLYHVRSARASDFFEHLERCTIEQSLKQHGSSPWTSKVCNKC